MQPVLARNTEQRRLDRRSPEARTREAGAVSPRVRFYLLSPVSVDLCQGKAVKENDGRVINQDCEYDSKESVCRADCGRKP